MSKSANRWADGTGRMPRPFQQTALDQIKSDFDSGTQVIAGNYPPGSGKSFMARALQRANMPCDIVTSDNNLIRETYCKTYTSLNAVMGKDHYESEELYFNAIKDARTLPSIFNPLSYYYARQRGLREPDLLVIDEAHLLLDYLMYISAYVIPIRKTKVPENPKSERDLIEWCYERYERLKLAISQTDTPGALYQEFERMSRLRATLKEGSQNQMFQISKELVPFNGRMQKCLLLTPLRTPTGLVKSLTSARRVLFMSGTMSKFDLF